jgi:lipoate-protein ligase A
VRRPLTVLTASVPGDPVLDTALSSAVLEGVVQGGPPVLRLWAPGPGVSFGRLDRLLPGFPAAVAAARTAGFAAVMRVGGGRAAAAHEGALVFGLAAPVAEDTTRRFETMAGVLCRALARVGVDAQRGELPGEYCPGAWSLHAGGVKLGGIAQRVRRRTAWTEGVLLVDGADRLREVLMEVHEALDLTWDPGTLGAVEDLVPGICWHDVAAALRAELAAEHELLEAAEDLTALALARIVRERHDAG